MTDDMVHYDHLSAVFISPDAVEDVDEDEEERDEQRHPARHHLGLDQEADPAGHHEHEARQVDLGSAWRRALSMVTVPGHLYLVLHLLPLQVDLEAAGGVVAGGEVHHLVLLRQRLEADVVGEAALPLGVVQELGGADDRLGGVVIWGIYVNQGWNFDRTKNLQLPTWNWHCWLSRG